MAEYWTRKRWFVGHRKDGKYEVFSCAYTPTQATHGKRYGYVMGDYRTKRRARQVKAYQS